MWKTIIIHVNEKKFTAYIKYYEIGRASCRERVLIPV